MSTIYVELYITFLGGLHCPKTTTALCDTKVLELLADTRMSGVHTVYSGCFMLLNLVQDFLYVGTGPHTRL